MFGRVPGMVQFVTDPNVWHEAVRLNRLAQERFPPSASSKRVLDPLRLIWRILTLHKMVRHDGSYLISSFLPPFPSRAFETLAFRNLAAVEVGEEGELVVPPMSIHIAITNSCPLRCWHCSKARRPDQHELRTDEWLRVLAELQEWGVAIIAFTGGEPLIHPQLERLVAAVDKRSTTYIFTSGYGLDKERARRLKDAGLYGAIVSLDHFEEGKHDAMRGFPGAYQAALNGLQVAREVGMYTMMQMVATKNLLRDGGMRKVLDLAQKVGAREVRILPPIPTGALLDAGDDILLTDEEREEIIAFDRSMNGVLGVPRVSSFLRAEGPELFGCGAGSQHSYIDAAGNVYPCDFVPLSFGCVAERSFKDIWSEVSTLMGRPRSRCFMRDNREAIRAASGGVLPLLPEASRAICQQAMPSSLPDYYRLFGQIFES